MRTLALFALTLPLFAQNARRLNRYEYNATIRDLLATPFQPAADFPADDSGYGFDNIASVLSLSPALMEKYLAAAEKIARAAIIPPTPPQPSAQRFAASDFHFKVDFEGDYDILIAVHGRHDARDVVFSVDGVPAATLLPDESGVAEFRVRFGPGNPRLRVDSQRLSYVELRGPYHPATPPLSESYRRVFRCGHAPGHHTLACARTNLADLARRAYRRPITPDEIDGLLRFVQQAETIDQGMELAVEAILVSPRFLFRIEPAEALDDF